MQIQNLFNKMQGCAKLNREITEGEKKDRRIL